MHPLSESQWNRGHFSMRKCESEKHKSLSMPAEGFKGHVATDSSLLGAAGKWGACGWSVVQLDYDGELGPFHGMYGSMEAEYDVQRTIKRAELTAFLCLLRKVIGPMQYAANFHCLVEECKDCEELQPKLKEKWSFVDRKNEGTKHRTDWCAEADRFRCMRCGRGSKHMKMPGK